MARQYFFTGTAAPTITPTYAGSIFVDTSGGKIYFATGTTSSADWDIMPINLSDITIDSDLALAGLYKIKKALALDFQPSAELTIATGAVTQTQSYHTVDTESDAASDDLDTITIATDMSVLLLTLENAARIVTLKHGTGNLNLPDDADIVMAENTVYFLLYNGSAWNLVGSSASGGGSSLPVADTTSIVEGSVDATKEMRIEVDGLTTATVRVATMPDKDITLGTDDDAIHDNVAGEIAAITEKTSMAVDDEFIIEDSEDSNNKKSLKRSTLGQDIQNTQTGTTYTLVLSDASKTVTMNNASAQTLTIPLNSSVAFSTNTIINVLQLGAGVTTIAGATGVTVNGVSAGSYDITSQYGGTCLIKTATDTWIVVSGGSGGGIFPATVDNDKTAAYTVVSGDVNETIVLTSAATADRKMTFDVSLLSSGDTINFTNENATYRMEIEVSNTGTMTMGNRTNIYLWEGEHITLGYNTATNARILARG